MALSLLAEALLRIEHKLDAILHAFEIVAKPMGFIGTACPVCKQPVQYQMDIVHNVVKRRCGCATGMIPSTIPLIPVGDSNVKGTSTSKGQPPGIGSSDTGAVEDGSSRSKVRNPGSRKVQG